MISVLIASDLCPIGQNESLFRQGRVNEIYNDILPEIENADLRIVNLECPLTDGGEPMVKTGPNLRAKEDCITGIKEAGFDVVSLANNHIMDYGPYGLQRTVEICKKAGLATVGAGGNLREAQRLFVRHIKNKRIAVLSVAEHEWSIADADSCGAAPLDIIQFFQVLERNAGVYDFLIVIIHGGKEDYPYPTPRMQELYRFLAKHGADAVICQHTHCPGSFELYRGVPIVYGQGNFIFDHRIEWSLARTKGFLVKLLISDNNKQNLELVPHIQLDREPGVKKMHGDEKRAFMDEIEARSRQIEDVLFVKQRWLDFCKEKSRSHLKQLKSHRRFFHSLNIRMHIDKLIYRSDWKHALLNRCRCESLREMQEGILNVLIADELNKST